VFLAVGEAIDGVSRRSPVVLLPNVEGSEEVLRDSFGRRVGAVGRETGVGVRVRVCEGSMASDMVSRGMRASMTRASTMIYCAVQGLADLAAHRHNMQQSQQAGPDVNDTRVADDAREGCLSVFYLGQGASWLRVGSSRRRLDTLAVLIHWRRKDSSKSREQLSLGCA